MQCGLQPVQINDQEPRGLALGKHTWLRNMFLRIDIVRPSALLYQPECRKKEVSGTALNLDRYSNNASNGTFNTLTGNKQETFIGNVLSCEVYIRKIDHVYAIGLVY